VKQFEKIRQTKTKHEDEERTKKKKVFEFLTFSWLTLEKAQQLDLKNNTKSEDCVEL